MLGVVVLSLVDSDKPSSGSRFCPNVDFSSEKSACCQNHTFGSDFTAIFQLNALALSIFNNQRTNILLHNLKLLHNFRIVNELILTPKNFLHCLRVDISVHLSSWTVHSWALGLV